MQSASRDAGIDKLVEYLRNFHSDGVKYYTTYDGCSCPDRRYRQHACKHMRRLRAAMELIEEQEWFNQQHKEENLDTRR